VPQNAAAVCAIPCDCAGDETWPVDKCSTSVGNLDVGAVCDGFEESQKRNFMSSEAWICD